jgi:uncharacterized membrane protein HdeD (DUF308 family)
MLNRHAVDTSVQERWVIFLVVWMLASAIFNLILAAIIIEGPPGAMAWALGLLVGINIVFGGLALIAMALARRSSLTAASTAASKAE